MAAEPRQIAVAESSSIKASLLGMVESRRQFAELRGAEPCQKGMAYVCFEDYVLQNGRGFTELCPRKYKPGRIKHCFQNARRLVQQTRGYLTYVEGYAYCTVGIPILHAWNMDPEGRLGGM